MFCIMLDDEGNENDGMEAETVRASRSSSSVSNITFDKSLPRTHAVSVWAF